MSAEGVFIQFIRGLADLLEEGLPVRKALECMKNSMRRTRCGRLAESVLLFVLEGYSLSSAIQLNTVIPVKKQAVCVMSAAEKTGNIVPALRFLIKNDERRGESVMQLFEISLYPALVLCVAGLGTAVLLKEYRQFSFAAPPAGALESCVRAGLFLVLYLLLFCFVYWRVFSEKAEIIFFYETAFLLSSGICMTDALHIISGFSDRKTALIAERMLPEIRSGVSFGDVFRKAFPGLSGSETQMFLDLASAGGNLAGACDVIWKRLNKKADGRKQLALRMAEPALLTGTGLCLLILLEGAVLPFLTQFGGVL